MEVCINFPWWPNLRIRTPQGIPAITLEMDYLRPINVSLIEEALKANSNISQVALVHFETGVGILNDIEKIGSIAKKYDCGLLVDAISSFGVLDLHFDQVPLIAAAASSNKCLHGVPGVSFVLVEKNRLNSEYVPKSLSLDLHAQYFALSQQKAWRFTPPIQVILALIEAIKAYFEAGGRDARYARYKALQNIITSGLSSVGIKTLVPQIYSAPIIQTFVLTSHKEYLNAQYITEELYKENIVIYSSVIKDLNSFRIGFIGELSLMDAKNLVESFIRVVNH